jgi:peptide/nickel transport system substrate-binding protein
VRFPSHGCGRSLLRILAIGILSALLFGCGSKEDASNELPAGTEPTPGGRLVVGVPSDPQNLNPLIRTGTLSGNILGIINPGLIRMNTDLLFEPNLASRWSWSEDRLDLTYELQPGYKWSDGEPFTAHDVVASWKLYVDERVESTRATNFAELESVQALDDLTVRFRYLSTSPDQLFNSFFTILPKHIVETLDPEDVRSWPINRMPVSLGAYRLREWKAGSHLTLERNPFWAGEAPYLDEIEFKIIPDESSRLVQLTIGEIDMVEWIAPKDIGRISEQHPELSLYQLDPRTAGVLSYNVNKGALKDQRVRQAISHAIDRTALIEGVIYGYAEPLATPVVPVHAWAQHPDLKPHQRDPEKARALLAEAGWTDSDGDGIVDRDGEALELMLRCRTGDLIRENGIIIIERNLRDIGIKATPRLMELSTTLERVHEGDFDIYYGHSTARLSMDFSSFYGSEGGFNLPGYANAEVDSLIRDGLAREDRSASLPYWLRFQEIIYEEQPTSMLYVLKPTVAIHSRFADCTPHALSTWEGIESWWLRPGG